MDPSEVPPLAVPGKVKLTRLERKMLRPWWRPVLEFIVYVLVCLLLAVLCKAFVVRAFDVPSESMNPTLRTGDKILVDVLSPRFMPYARGDVVVFADSSDWLGNGVAADSGATYAWENILVLTGLVPDNDGYLVKRLIGLPGETVEGLADGTILIDGDPLLETWAQEGAQAKFTVTLGDDEYWMLGDNRPHSADSRLHGAVPGKDFVGRVGGIVFPLDRLGLVDWRPWNEFVNGL